MEYVHYKCITTDLELIEFENIPTAFKATFTCDSPYAYKYPCTYEYSVENTFSAKLYNESSINGYYKPKIEIDLGSGDGFAIINDSDPLSNGIVFWKIPPEINRIIIDNENGILSSNNPNINLYQYFNLNFFRLVKGINTLKFIGNGTVRIICEYPVNIGG
jgi:phage-related protein